jgi:hypothetical protein
VLVFDLSREKIDVFVTGKIIEPIVEHAADIVLAIVHNLLCLFVPKHRHSDAFVVIRISCLVRLV